MQKKIALVLTAMFTLALGTSSASAGDVEYNIEITNPESNSKKTVMCTDSGYIGFLIRPSTKPTDSKERGVTVSIDGQSCGGDIQKNGQVFTGRCKMMPAVGHHTLSFTVQVGESSPQSGRSIGFDVANCKQTVSPN